MLHIDLYIAVIVLSMLTALYLWVYPQMKDPRLSFGLVGLKAILFLVSEIPGAS